MSLFLISSKYISAKVTYTVQSLILRGFMPDKYICFNPKFHLLDLILRFSWTLSRKEERGMHFKRQEYIKFFFISYICFACVEYLIKRREVKIYFYLEIRKALKILNTESCMMTTDLQYGLFMFAKFVSI